jgi:hypothetical protein
MKSSVKIAIIIVAGVVLLVTLYFLLDFWKYRPHTIQCDDGEHQTIDFRDIQLKYSANKISLEVEVINKLKLRPEIDPQVLQTAVESTQGWDQFLKGLVVGFNSCAINKADYALILQRYKSMEDTSKNLAQLLQKRTLTQQDVETATQLIKQYSSLSRELFTRSDVK